MLNQSNLGLKSSHLLFAFIAVLASSLVAYVLLVDELNLIEKICGYGFALVLLFLVTTVVIPAEERKQRTIRYLIWALVSLSVAAISGPIWLTFLANSFPNNNSLKVAVSSYSTNNGIIVFTLVLIVFSILIYTLRDKSPLGRLDTTITDDFPDLNFQEKNGIFKKALKSSLEKLDDELSWDAKHFVPLDAEIEIINEHRTSRKVTDLVQALKTINTSSVNLVLGVPGSGKSVALRKMCTDLLKQTKVNDRIPVYVNLKEWYSERTWTTDNPPTEDELRNFVYKNIRERLVGQSKTFFDEFFERMIDKGIIFFVFDSFDEIPGILDSDESSELLVKISDLLVSFLKSGLNSRGIVASRYYRRPRINIGDRSVLEIKPLTELQISYAISKSSSELSKLSTYLFHKRPDLAAASRNPFVLSLLVKYVSKFNNLPDRQADLFKHYISDSLQLADETFKTTALSHDSLITAMREMSWIMFESDRYGLEMPLAVIIEKLPHIEVENVVSILQKIRLARVSSNNKSFSFVHRRFNEYFLVQKFIDYPDLAPFDSIPLDSRWRDAMVLYTEVASDEQASKIAEFCFPELESLDSIDISVDRPRYLRGLHSLRFLVEAYRGRKVALKGIQSKLGNKVLELLSEDSDDLISKKHAVESIGILSEQNSQKVLIKALNVSNSWISETAFKASRYLTKLDTKAKELLLEYLRKMSVREVFKRNKELSFALDYAEIYKPLLKEFKLIKLENYLNIIGILGIIILFKYEYLALIFVMSILTFIQSRGWSEFSKISYIDFIRTTTRIISFVVILLPLIILLIMLFSFLPFVEITSTHAPENNQIFSLFNFRNSPLIISLFLVSCLLTLPWLKIFRVVRGFNYFSITKVVKKIKDLKSELNLKRLFIDIFSSILSLIKWTMPIFIILIFVYFINSLPKETSSPIWGVIALVLLSSITISILVSFRTSFLDKSQLNKSMQVFSPHRLIIAENFYKLGSSKSRLKYVQWVEQNCGNHLSELENPENTWPDDKRPNINNDEGSTLLAQLDAKWLKLDI